MALDPNPSRKLITEIAKQHGSGFSSTYRVLSIARRKKHIFRKVLNGELSISAASQEAGFHEYSPMVEASTGRKQFGRGDKFWEAFAPLGSYLNSWKRHSYRFTHLTPREAARRARKVELVIAELEAAKKDLDERAQTQSLSLR